MRSAGRRSAGRSGAGGEQVDEATHDRGVDVLALVLLGAPDHDDRGVGAVGDGGVRLRVVDGRVGQRSPQPGQGRDGVGRTDVRRSAVAQVRAGGQRTEDGHPAEPAGVERQHVPVGEQHHRRCSGLPRQGAVLGLREHRPVQRRHEDPPEPEQGRDDRGDGPVDVCLAEAPVEGAPECVGPLLAERHLDVAAGPRVTPTGRRRLPPGVGAPNTTTATPRC